MERQSIAVMAIGSMLLAVYLLTTACTDNYDNASQQPMADGQIPITFIVDDTQDWYQTGGDETLTRAAANGAFAPKTLATSTTGCGEGLTITATVVNGINTSSSLDNRGTTTRGIPHTSLTSTFGLNGYTYDATEEWDEQLPNFLYNQEVSKTGDIWSTTDPIYWPSGNHCLRCYAYSPYPGTGITLSPDTYGGTPYIDFTAQENVEEQIDLMTAASSSYVYERNTTIKLPFRHALTCIKFAIGTGLPANCTIKTIRLKNIVSRGMFHLDNRWVPSTAPDDKKNFLLTNLEFSTNSALNTEIISQQGENYSTFLLIPQTFTSDDQKIEVVYEDAVGTPTTLSASLNTTTWLPGTTVTYIISTTATKWDYVLTTSSAIVSHNGGDASFTVTSYRQNAAGTKKESVPWEIIGYSTDGVNFSTDKPKSANWLGIITNSGSGSTEAQMGHVSINAQTAISTGTLTAAADKEVQEQIIVANGIRGDAGHFYDLSKHDRAGNTTAQNTANCYIVNAAGFYKFPIVYGNAIKNNQDNQDAYKKSPGKNYKDNPITTPYVYDDGTIGDAIVVWQDVDGLISNLSLSDNNTYVSFTIDTDHATQGNALIAVRDNSNSHNIMWSWHIWVTGIDIDATIPLTSYPKVVYKVMPVQLGWCSLGSEMKRYANRELYVKVQQNSGNTAIFRVVQTGGATYEKPKNGNCPFYQWGRKDPMRGFRECGMTTPTRKTYYDHNGYSWDVIWSASSIGTSIKNPHKFISANDNTYGHWYSYPNYPTDDLCNSWNAGISGVGQPWYAYDKVIKTIYDPCPVGFHIPTPYIYLGFLNVHWIEDTKSTSSSEWEGSYSATDKAWSFYTDGTRRNEFYMPLTGYYTDKAVAESTCFFEWFAYSGAAYFGPFAQLGKGDFIMPYNSKGWTGYAMACRPQAEEDW